MAEKLSPEAKAYAESRGLIVNWDLATKTVARPREGYNLELKVFSKGKQIPCMNNGDIALLRNGDVLEMRNFNRFVKRAFQLPSKDKVNVTVSTNKKGLFGIQCCGRFMPFDALRGYVSFGVEYLTPDRAPHERGEYVTI